MVAADSSKCAFSIAGSSLFHVLETRIKERRRSAKSEQLKELEAKVAAYLQYNKLSSETPAALSRKRSSKATAASLHGLGIVVPCDAKKDTGYRELPVVGEKLAALFQLVVSGDASARKSLSGLLTRATIANDELDFGTSLLLGLDLFTVGSALEVRLVMGADGLVASSVEADELCDECRRSRCSCSRSRTCCCGAQSSPRSRSRKQRSAAFSRKPPATPTPRAPAAAAAGTGTCCAASHLKRPPRHTSQIRQIPNEPLSPSPKVQSFQHSVFSVFAFGPYLGV